MQRPGRHLRDGPPEATEPQWKRPQPPGAPSWAEVGFSVGGPALERGSAQRPENVTEGPPRSGGAEEAGGWPLPFRPCRPRDLPHLALSVSPAAPAAGTLRGRPACLSHGDGHLPRRRGGLELHSIHKTHLDLKTCECARGEK